MSMITSMCELTSRKILEQAQEIDALYDTVVKAVEDIGTLSLHSFIHSYAHLVLDGMQAM